jgi:hypothetical protein
MALTTVGATWIMKALMDDSPTHYSNANAYLGVGDSSTAFAIGQTDLQAASNKVRKGMESSYPSRSSNAVTFRALFATGEGNFAWNEWGLFNASSAGEMFSRKVESLGTKTSAAAWQFTVTLTGTAS